MRNKVKKTKSIINFSSEFEQYLPSEEQLHQLTILFELIDKCKQSRVEVCIVGGYGLDALYGSLTRDHGDIDMLVRGNELQDMRDIVEKMGFIEDTGDTDQNKNLYRPGNNLALPSSFKIEFGTIDSYSVFFPIEMPLESLVSKDENGSIMGKPIKTLTLEGHKIVAEVQKRRAADGGWGEYKHQEHFEKIISVLGNKK